AVDRETGAERWMFRTSAPIYSSPVIAGEYVLIGSTDGSVYALRASGGPLVQRAVFFDSTLLRLSHVNAPAVAARFLANRGYRTLDSPALGTFLRDRVADRAPSVVVFAIDYVPPAVLSAPV